MLRTSFLLAASVLSANAQSLYEALSKFPELSDFAAFYSSNEALASAYFGNKSAYPITFLAPNNEAIANLQQKLGVTLANIPIASLLEIVQYHTLVSNLTTTDFDNGGKQGLTVPTMLNNGINNNRTVGVNLASRFGGPEKAAGQVVFIKGADSGSPGRFRLMSRQDGGQPQSTIRSGLSSNVGIKALDNAEGLWEGGRFHIVDGLLTPPTTCVATIRGAGLENLDNALNRSMLWSALDGSKNITCLGPNNAAFRSAGTPDASLNSTDLAQAILFHTLPEVAYSDYLYDGQEFKSLQNGTVRVKVVGEGKDREIYFNNAKVIDANVLTHNGLVHVLDAVMLPLEQLNSTNATSSAKPSSTPSATGSGSGTSASGTPPASTGAAATVAAGLGEWNWTLWALLSSLFMMA
ncbi:FAS1 domain-containing protein [Pyrenochaeta sp. MPI-SDFR-AT-0127]|nr:FAS1 domain-containing protein [Pyrenochaeta sp. MPI-SDFR-AT-0127]